MSTVELNLRPFITPNFVIAETLPGNRGEGMKEAPSFPLSAVDAESLSLMCDAFRHEVFKKANAQDPRLK